MSLPVQAPLSPPSRMVSGSVKLGNVLYAYCPNFHALEPLGTSLDDGWLCDGAKKPSGCKSGISQFYQSAGLNRYRCNICNHDLCQKCVQDFEVPVVCVPVLPVAKQTPLPSPAAFSTAVSSSFCGTPGPLGPLTPLPSGPLVTPVREVTPAPSTTAAPAAAAAVGEPPRLVSAGGPPPVAAMSVQSEEQEYLRVHNELAIPLMRQTQHLGRAYRLFEEASRVYARANGRVSCYALYNMACCLSLGAAADLRESPGHAGGGPGCGALADLPPWRPDLAGEELREARLDLAIAKLGQALDAGFADMSRVTTDTDLQALRDRRPTQYAALVRRMAVSLTAVPEATPLCASSRGVPLVSPMY